MNTMLGRLMFVVVLPLFVLIAGDLFQESQAGSFKSSCLRRCHRLFKNTAASKVSFSCHELCKETQVISVAEQRGLAAHSSMKQRIRKALKAIPECSMSSLNQKVDWTPSEVNVTFGQYKKTSHWYANISWTPLNETYGNWSGIVVKLTVKNAHPILKGVYPSSCSQHPKNQTFLQVNLSSYGYLFPDVIYLRILALPYSPKEDISDVLSFKPPVPTSSSLVNQRTAGSNKGMKYVSSSVGIVAGVLAVVLAGVCHKRFTRICLQYGYIRPSGDLGPENYDCDAFIIFRSDDLEWVEERLLPLLEGKHKLRCRIHHRDFRAGGIIYDLISDSVYKSYKNVVVFSSKFLNGRYCRYELDQAKQRLLERNDDSLVIIRIDDVDLGSLPEDLRERSVIDYGSNHEKPHWKKKLLEFLGVPHKYKRESTKSNDTEVSVLEPVNGDVFENGHEIAKMTTEATCITNA